MTVKFAIFSGVVRPVKFAPPPAYWRYWTSYTTLLCIFSCIAQCSHFYMQNNNLAIANRLHAIRRGH